MVDKYSEARIVKIPCPDALITAAGIWGLRLCRVFHGTATRINSRGLRPWRAAVWLFPAFSWMMRHREGKETKTLRDFTAVGFEEDECTCEKRFC